jgi:mono/diheme cytochrome c family protein
MRLLIAALALPVIAAAAGGLWLRSGLYDIGADAPHTAAVTAALETLRERSISRHAAGIAVPPLDNPARIAEGASEYAEMCAGCHLAPGMAETEIRAGLYPQPPKLADPWPNNPAEQFWVLKHGIKLTAMPAWGPTHDDQTLWAIVAFLQKIQTLTPQQYAQMTAGAGQEHESHQHHNAE